MSSAQKSKSTVLISLNDILKKGELFDIDDVDILLNEIKKYYVDKIHFSFKGIKKVTQLFVSVLVRKLCSNYGEYILDNIEFIDCEDERCNLRLFAAIDGIKFHIKKEKFLTISQEQKIDELISSININKANLEHIMESGKINGELYVEIKRIINEFTIFKMTRDMYLDTKTL